MGKRQKSPTLQLHLTDEQRERAIASNSGGCLIADAIKEQYPHLTNISVDMATIRVSDRAAGERYTYLTPPDAQHTLLSFDQGWPTPVNQLKIHRAIHVMPITSQGSRPAHRNLRKQRDEARAQLEAKEADGTITEDEQKFLNLSRASKAKAEKAAKKRKPRPTSEGSPTVHDDGGGRRPPVVEGGKAPVQGPAHPNLLRGRNRHFGAKLADPGAAFREAVEAEVAARQQD